MQYQPHQREDATVVIPETDFERDLCALAVQGSGVLGQLYGYRPGVVVEMAHPRTWGLQGRLQGYLRVDVPESTASRSLLDVGDVLPIYFWIEQTSDSNVRIWWEMPANAYGHAQSNTVGNWPVLNLPDA